MKVCVYAICKNEEKFVDRWMSSMQEADEIYILDTGSTDNTLNLLKNYPKVTIIQKEIKPWRFDTARNESMKLLPEDTDICVNSDFDQIWPKNWRKRIEAYFKEGYNKVTGVIRTFYENDYYYDVSSWYNIHFFSKNWKWRWPVHENLYYDGPQEDVRDIEDRYFIIEHRQDPSKDRTQYLKLLENWNTSDEEEYAKIIAKINLADEYRRKNQFEKAIQTCKQTIEDYKDLKINDLLYDLYLMQADCYKELKDYNSAITLIDTCLDTCKIYTRKIFKMKADIFLSQKDFFNGLQSIKKVLEIKIPIYVTPQKYWLEEERLFNNEESINFLNQFEEYLTTWYEWSILGDCYNELGLFLESKRCYKTSIDIKEDEIYNYYYLGKLLIEEGSYYEAINLLDKAPKKFKKNDYLNPPDYYQVARLIWLTQANFYIKEYFRALGFARTAKEIEVKDPDMKNAIITNYNMCLSTCLEKINGK